MGADVNFVNHWPVRVNLVNRKHADGWPAGLPAGSALEKPPNAGPIRREDRAQARRHGPSRRQQGLLWSLC